MSRVESADMENMEDSNQTGVLRATLEFLSTRFNNFLHLVNRRVDQKVESPCCQGYRAIYVGKETVNIEVLGVAAQTYDCVERLLERIAIGQDIGVSYNTDVYVDVPRCNCINVYEVNSSNRVTAMTQFDLSRVAFCTGGEHHAYDHCLLAWLYRQETPVGFQLECHVIRLSTRIKARRLAALIGASFNRAFADVRVAVEIGCQLGCQLALSSWSSTAGTHCLSNSQHSANTYSFGVADSEEKSNDIDDCVDNTVSCYKPIAMTPTSDGETLITSAHRISFAGSVSSDDDVFMAHN